jgi:hypothetical protein
MKFTGYDRILILATVIFLSGMSTTVVAQHPFEVSKDTLFQELPQQQRQVAVSYDDEIRKNEVPETVTSSVKNSYMDYKITKAYRGSDGSYKLILKNRDEKLAAFYDARGDFSRLEELNEEDEHNINDDWR